MRKIDRSTAFRRDYKREAKGKYRATLLGAEFEGVVLKLAQDISLETKYRDHILTGNWRGCRECYPKPDLLLIYKKQEEDVLELVRLGSHSELFG